MNKSFNECVFTFRPGHLYDSRKKTRQRAIAMAEIDAQKCFDVALDLVKQAGKVGDFID